MRYLHAKYQVPVPNCNHCCNWPGCLPCPLSDGEVYIYHDAHIMMHNLTSIDRHINKCPCDWQWRWNIGCQIIVMITRGNIWFYVKILCITPNTSSQQIKMIKSGLSVMNEVIVANCHISCIHEIRTKYFVQKKSHSQMKWLKQPHRELLLHPSLPQTESP